MLFFHINSDKLITFNFTKNLTKIKSFSPGGKVNYMDLYKENILYINNTLGSNKQHVPLQIKMKSYGTQVLSRALNPKNIDYFDNTTSTSYNLIQASTYSLNKGYLSTDVLVDQQGTEIKHFNFFFVDEPDNMDINCLNLGLYFTDDDKSTNVTNILYTLKSQDYIDRYTFSFQFDPHSSKAGQIIFGQNITQEMPRAKYAVWNDNVDFYLKFKSVKAGSFELTKSETPALSYVKLRIEEDAIYFPSDYKEYVLENFFNKEPAKSKCMNETSEDSNFYIIKCDKDIDLSEFDNLTFYNDEMELSFTLTAKDMFVSVDKFKYFKGMMPFDSSIFENEPWSFGTLFLRKYQIIFDNDNKIMGFAKNNTDYEEEEETNSGGHFPWFTVLLIIGIILFIGAAAYLVLFVFKKEKSQSPYQIHEDVDYNASNSNNNALGIA